MPTIKLQSSDGDIFPVDVEIAKQFITIKTMLNHFEVDKEEEKLVPLPNINMAILKKVIQPARGRQEQGKEYRWNFQLGRRFS